VRRVCSWGPKADVQGAGVGRSFRKEWNGESGALACYGAEGMRRT
jgi:hypothetical protein